MSTAKHVADAVGVTSKVAQVYQTRVRKALENYEARLQKQRSELQADVSGEMPLEALRDAAEYTVDSMQRAVLFMDALRQRGNQYLEHNQAGLPPVLDFDYEMVEDARSYARPVNYALVKIVPPAGVTVDPERRPYVIIDPRAGHGPGIGGFKDDSQVGVALRDGHPVYFVIFFPMPEPGQTLLDVCAAERRFIRRVRKLHPASPKPAIVGNCQGGWAAMMLAASYPEDTGPIVINGAPMSYWGGAWQDGPSDNPMRYAGGLLGGSWLASLTADMGAGLFDGAWLVQNFENLNPANTFWDKYYHVYRNVDTEVPRFLEFERWWGGFYLMNREEIEWITQNLFVGNKLWKGGTAAGAGKVFDLREIRSPIVLFASMGDNITPPQQAFNWVADVYESTDEIKARGQVIVGLLHENAGHLGIFVSGSVARKEHAQIISVLKSIEALPPGLYGMAITETGSGDRRKYQVEFRERRLEDMVKRLNRFGRKDEKAFEAVARMSSFQQTAYELFVRPWVQAMSNEATARVARELHPLRMQRWWFSDSNPWMSWVGTAAEQVRQQRAPLDASANARKAEGALSEAVSATLDAYRALRDATSEALFFQSFGSMFALSMEDDRADTSLDRTADVDEYVEQAIADAGAGGYAEAVTRIGALIARRGEPLPLERVALSADLRRDYAALLPAMEPADLRRIRGEQELLVKHAPDQALATLPALLHQASDRTKLLRLVEALLDDPRIEGFKPTAAQRAMVQKLRTALRRGTARSAKTTRTAAAPRRQAAARKGRRAGVRR